MVPRTRDSEVCWATAHDDGASSASAAIERENVERGDNLEMVLVAVVMCSL
jgi:hypothetical protein